MCVADDCNWCHKVTWAGCGLHIDKALKNVPLEERCAGWKTGNCPSKKPSKAESSFGECEHCQMGFTASSQTRLEKVIFTHMLATPDCMEKDKKKNPERWKLNTMPGSNVRSENLLSIFSDSDKDLNPDELHKQFKKELSFCQTIDDVKNFQLDD
mmetsp:Transcript_14345/g.25798  ORF Transcript_14345/g.25798 Transcript_14345/m.25798 type:complete len:155 (+) Transcript_14345:237-701(+)